MDTMRPTGAEPRAAGGLPRTGTAPWRATAALAALLVLAGCSGSPTDGLSGGATPSATPSASAVATPDPSVAESASSTLTPEQQQAFDEATATVLAFEQVIVDLYSGARTQINDLDGLAMDPTLDRTRINVSQGLAQGFRSESVGARLELVDSALVEISSRDGSEVITVRVCIDYTSDTRIDSDGNRTSRGREQYTYGLVRTDYLPPPGWAVAEVFGDVDEKNRAC